MVGASSIVFLYGGYRLPQTDIHPDLFPVIANWCVRTIEGMVGILLLLETVTGMDDPISTTLILVPLASVAGLGYVADNGAGISADDGEAIFKTGYTTAGSRGGMGLGLTFVNEMAEVYEWTCSVTKSATGGARFEFENVTNHTT